MLTGVEITNCGRAGDNQQYQGTVKPPGKVSGYSATNHVHGKSRAHHQRRIVTREGIDPLFGGAVRFA